MNQMHEKPAAKKQRVESPCAFSTHSSQLPSHTFKDVDNYSELSTFEEWYKDVTEEIAVNIELLELMITKVGRKADNTRTSLKGWLDPEDSQEQLAKLIVARKNAQLMVEKARQRASEPFSGLPPISPPSIDYLVDPNKVPPKDLVLQCSSYWGDYRKSFPKEEASTLNPRNRSTQEFCSRPWGNYQKNNPLAMSSTPNPRNKSTVERYLAYPCAPNVQGKFLSEHMNMGKALLELA